MFKIKDNNLYLVLTEEYAHGRGTLDIAEKAIAGGVDIIQMREKRKPRDELLRLGKAMATLCRQNGVIFIVNDDPVLASQVDADGVHLGQEDKSNHPIEKTRQLLGKSKIIGISTHSLEQFLKANDEDADYIAFGPIFYTKTKDYFIGTSDIRNVLQNAAKPVFFIGGINLSNINELIQKGARNIAVIRGILDAGDITSRVREFKSILTEREGVHRI